MKTSYMKYLMATALLTCYGLAHAEDIDLFVNPPSSALPNVLFIVDNTANWTTPFTNEIAALSGVFAGLPVNADGSANFNIGVMFFSETGNPNSGPDGGYIRAAIRPMTAANLANYKTMIAALDVGRDKGNKGEASLAMAEAYRYFSAGAAYAGNFKAKADYTGNTGSTWSNSSYTAATLAAMQKIYLLPGNALSSFSASNYRSPIGPGCAKNFIIYLSNGPAQDSNSGLSQALSMLTAAGGDVTEIPISPAGSLGNWSDEWARFMHTSSLGVVTYTIDVDPGTTGQGPGWTAVLKSMADVSLGKYTPASSSGTQGQDIATAINKDLSEIQAVNSVFASVSLPVSVNSQGTYLNQVFIGMFRPDPNANPRWNGNLKQYQLGLISGILQLEDADSNSAINNQTGFITECARSFWTPTTPDPYWVFSPQGGCIPPPGSAPGFYTNSNFPDGNVVEKGAAGYVRRSSTARVLKTCSLTVPGSACNGSIALQDFNTSNSDITAALLGAQNPPEQSRLISWAMGLDTEDENGNKIFTAEMRPSVHGDVVHSRPAALNFGTSTTPQVVVFYGGNDGVFRAINGNTSTNFYSVASGSTVSVAPGAEFWAFMPPEFYPNIKRIHDDTTQISYPTVTTLGALPKPYGMDGPITAYQDSSGTRIYAAMRRGGRVLYAFNVPDTTIQDPTDSTGKKTTTALNVSLKWKFGCPNDTVTGLVSDAKCVDASGSTSTAFSGLGQTWSSAKTLFAPGYGSGTSPVIIMGGGYDPCEDTSPNSCTALSKGHQVYVLDANTGALLNTLNTDRGVIADVAIVPDSTTGLAKFAYVADLGGNIYRVDIGTNSPGNWTITKIASLGCATVTPCTNNRKFMFAPDVVADNGGYDLLLGSGDREKPLLGTSGVVDYFFMVKDRPADNTWLSSEISNCGSAVLCLNSLVGITTGTPSTTTLLAKKGWYLALAANEQVVTSAITIFGVVTFSTHQPAMPQAGACTSNLGIARVYNISYLNAACEICTTVNGIQQRYDQLPPNIGLPPSPVAGTVAVGGQDLPFCIGCSKDSPLQSTQPTVPPGSTLTQPKGRVYWYIQRQ
jgi:type IV pilus assembly protein PilY1